MVDVEDVDVLAPDDILCPKVLPPLTIISLAIRTVVHVATNTSEVVCASARVWADCEFPLILNFDQ
jgi:DNA polymerase alpha subunit A